MADEPDIAAPREVIEHHLRALGVEAELPEAALRACVAQFAQAAQPLRALLDRAAAGKQLNDEEWLRFIRGLHVLAAARDEESCPSLLRLLQRPADEVDDLLGDVITASLPAILTSLFDGDTDAFLALVANRDADDFVRGAVLTSAIHLSWTGRIERERLRTCLVHLHRTRAAEQGAYVWYAWMRAITLLDFGDLMPLVEAAWKAKWIDQSMQHWSEVRTDLARARTAYGDARRLKDLYAGPVDDVVAALDWTWPANEGDVGNADAEPWDAQSSMPAVNLFRSVGRNDPCPCGSGKKAKKCCLATA